MDRRTFQRTSRKSTHASLTPIYPSPQSDLMPNGASSCTVVVAATSTDWQALPQASQHPLTLTRSVYVYDDLTTILRGVIDSTTHDRTSRALPCPSQHPPWASRSICYCYIRPYARLRGTTIGATAMKNSRSRSTTSQGRTVLPQESRRRARPGWIYPLSSKKGDTICSLSATD